MAIGAPQNITLPTVGGSSGSWGSELNSALNTLIASVEAKVTASALDLNDTVDFQNQVADRVQQVKGQNLTATKTGAANANSHYFVDGDWYITDGDANVIRVTTGGALNIAVSGGFTGDYGGSTEEAQYSNSSKLYSFLQASSHRAKIDSAEHRLYEESQGTSSYVALKSPGSLATSYDWTYPTALPGAGETHLVTVDENGDLDTTADPSVDTLTASGDITASGDVNGSTVNGTDGTTAFDATNSGVAALRGGVHFGSGSDTLSNYIDNTGPISPVIQINGSNYGGSYSTQEAHYTQIGSLAIVSALIVTDSSFSASTLSKVEVVVPNIPLEITDVPFSGSISLLSHTSLSDAERAQVEIITQPASQGTWFLKNREVSLSNPDSEVDMGSAGTLSLAFTMVYICET